MEDKYFKPAGDLTDEINPEDKYFKPAGDLDDEKMYVEDSFFRPAGDLSNNASKKTNNNEEIVSKLNNDIDKIRDYLLTIVSGKRYDNVCELGVLMGAGRMIVTLEELIKMVDEGYNIVSANVINANMIEIEFQRYVYDEEKMERWRRF